MKFSGSICALATAFHDSGEAVDDGIDFDAYGRLIDWQLRGGTAALVCAGSTGEAAALDDAEFSQLIEFAAEHTEKRVPILAGTGLQSTHKTILQTQRAAHAGADAALVVTPAYVRPTQEGLYRHYCEVAEHGDLPVMLYNVPTRTACDMQPGTCARLASHGNIVGIKEALAEPRRMEALLELKSDSFSVLSGDDPSSARAMLAGADGVVSVAANVAPQAMRDLHLLCAQGRRADAERFDASLLSLYALLGIESNPIPLKWCLQAMGLGSARLRLPLVALGAAHHARVLDVLEKLNLLELAPNAS